MPKPLDNNWGFTTAAITLVTVAETLLVTTGFVILPYSIHHVLVRGWISATIGTLGTSLTLRIYRGATITGTLVLGGPAVTVTAGNVVTTIIAAEEDLANVGQVQYTLSAQVGAATGNSTVNAAYAEVTVM